MERRNEFQTTDAQERTSLCLAGFTLSNRLTVRLETFRTLWHKPNVLHQTPNSTQEWFAGHDNEAEELSSSYKTQSSTANVQVLQDPLGGPLSMSWQVRKRLTQYQAGGFMTVCSHKNVDLTWVSSGSGTVFVPGQIRVGSQTFR